jgi:hypothetical protein
MASKKYTCTNFANCDAALAKQVIEIEDGEEAVCPACNSPKSLVSASGPSRSGGARNKTPLIAAGALLAVVLIGWLVWPSAPRDPAAMLTEFFPRLQ